MIIAERTIWASERDTTLVGIRAAYETMTPCAMSAELSRIVAAMDKPDARRSSDAKLALVAGADCEARAQASALLGETSLGVVECASAEAALAVLVKEADRTVLLLSDETLAGPRDAETLAGTVRMLWPTVQVAVSCGDASSPCRTDEAGIARLSRPWRGLDLLVQAERALAAAA